MCTNVNTAVEPTRGLIAAVHMTTQQKTADKVIALNQRNPKRTGSSLQRVLAELRGPQRLWTTTLAALIASLGPLLGGYTLGFASPALLQLNDDLVPSDYHLDGVVLGLFTALAFIGAIVGGFVAGWVADAVGRKSALMLSAVLNLLGWLIFVGAGLWRDPVGFKSLLLIGRLITGCGLGWGLVCAPVYIGEVSTPALRGLYGTLPGVSLSVGVLLVYLLGAIPGFSYEYIALVAVVITAVFVLLLAPPWIPMTPRYLLMKGRWEEALKELKWLRGPQVSVIGELQETSQVVEGTTRISTREFFTELGKRKSLISLFLMVFVMAFQLLSGIDILISFAGSIIKNAGFSNPHVFASLSIAVVMVVFTVVQLVIVDMFGRKILLVVSGLTMAASGFALGTYFYLTQNCEFSKSITSRLSGSDDPMICLHLKPLVITAIATFVIGFGIGWASIPFLLVPELLSLKTRGIFAGVVAAVNWGSSGLVTGTYHWYAGVVHLYGAWFTFGIINLISTTFVSIFVPETKGKTLEDIEEQLQNRYRLCIWS